MFSRWWAVCALLLLTACSRRDERPFHRVAVLPFENLTADQNLNWCGRAMSVVLVSQSTGSPHWNAIESPSLRDAAGAGASEIVQGYLTGSRDSFKVEAVLENARTHKIVKRVSADGPASNGILPLANSVASQLGIRARPFGTRNEAALRYFIGGSSSPEPNVAAKSFEAALNADPGFGEAYVALAQWLLTNGDRPGAQRVLTAASRNASRIPEIERARLQFVSATIHGDREGRYAALARVAHLVPADASILRNLAQTDLTRRDYAKAAGWYRKAIEREPENPLLLNELGYAESYAGDLDAAVKSLNRYRELRPADANPLDSLGDVHFAVGRFAEAGKYYTEAHAKDGALLKGANLEKAAHALLMTGDVKGADQLFAKYLELRRNLGDSLVEYRQARWEYATGRTKPATERLERMAQTGRGTPVFGLAAVQLAVWRLERQDRNGAREYASAALGNSDAVSRAFAELAAFVSDSSASAGEWAQRAERSFPAPAQASFKQLALAYGLLLDGKFGEAVPLLRQLYQASPPGSPQSPNILLAWALAESGQAGLLGDLLDRFPIPQPNAEWPFESLVFPRALFLRGLALGKLGRHDDAKFSFQLFSKIVGDSTALKSEQVEAQRYIKGS